MHILSLFASRHGQAIAALFRDHPEEWRPGGEHYNQLSGGRFEVYNTRRGITVWVSNQAYGLHVVYGDGFRIYDVTFWCLVGGSPDQHLIWGAYKAWRTGRASPTLLTTAKAGERAA